MVETNKAQTAHETFDIVLPIKESKKHSQPFKKKLPSNMVTAIVLSYLSSRDNVCFLMQVLSNESRAYLVQQYPVLKGFLVSNLAEFDYLSKRAR